MTKLGATGLVAAFIGALCSPIALLVALHSDVDDASRWLPLALPAVFIASGVLLAFIGRRRRRPRTSTQTKT